MKEFNLEKALTGEPVITREGTEVTQLCYQDVESAYKLVGVVNRVRIMFTDKGRYSDLKVSTGKHDLFMATVTRTAWINIYRDAEEAVYRYDTERGALDAARDNVIATVKVEWEE